MAEPLHYAAWLIARRLAEKWDATLEQAIRTLIRQDCYTDALLMAQELHDRVETGMRGELCDQPGRLREERVHRRAAEVLRMLSMTADEAVEYAPIAGEDRREEPGGSGAGLRAERTLGRLTAT